MGARKKTGSPPGAAPARAALAALVAAALALVGPAAAGAAEVEFYATADKEQLSVDDTLTLTVTVGLDAGSGDSEELQLPEAPDFEVLSRSKSQQMSFAMGRGGPPTFRKVRIYTLILQPRRTGTFTIKPGKLVFRGKTHLTAALRVKVVAPGGAGSRPPRPGRPGADPDDDPDSLPRRQPPPLDPRNPFGNLGGIFGDDPDAQDLLEQFFGSSRPASETDIYVRAHVDRRQAYLGEQVTYSIYLFARNGLDISGIEGLKMPRLDGFWAEDLETPQQITGELKVIDGVPYRVFLLRKRALYPTRSGRLPVDPVEVDVSTGFGWRLHGGKVHRKSQPISVEVLPLPAGAPAGFETANVGQWRMSGEAAPTSTQLGQPVTLKVTIEGVGNLHQIVAPALPEIPGLRSYDPTITEKTTTARGRFGGRRVLEYLLMPEQTGSFEIPPLVLRYFDPAAREYRQASTQPIALRVEGGAGAGRPGVAANGSQLKNVIDAGGLRALRYQAELSRPGAPLYRRSFFVPVAAAPLALWALLLGLALARSALRPSAEGIQRGLAGKARRRLRKARALCKANQPDAFYAEVSRALVDYLSARLAAPVAGLTRPDLAARLGAAGLPEALCRRLGTVLDRCDAGRFAPGGSSPEAMVRLLEEAIAVMEGIDGARLTVAASEPAQEPQA